MLVRDLCCLIRCKEQTWTCSGETGSTVELSSTTGPSRQSLPQYVPLPEQGAQTTGNTARTPRCPWGHDAVHWRRGDVKKYQYFPVLFSLMNTFEVAIYLTTVFLIWSIHTVLLQVASAVQVNTLPTGTRELFGGAGAGHPWSDCWSSCGAWEENNLLLFNLHTNFSRNNTWIIIYSKELISCYILHVFEVIKL